MTDDQTVVRDLLCEVRCAAGGAVHILSEGTAAFSCMHTRTPDALIRAIRRAIRRETDDP